MSADFIVRSNWEERDLEICWMVEGVVSIVISCGVSGSASAGVEVNVDVVGGFSKSLEIGVSGARESESESELVLVVTSRAPASIAGSRISSRPTPCFGSKTIRPFRSKAKAVPVNCPPHLVMTCRRSWKVRFLLSVRQSMTQDTWPGSIASMRKGSRAAPDSDLPCPLRMAVSMRVLEAPDFLARDIRWANCGLKAVSAPEPVERGREKDVRQNARFYKGGFLFGTICQEREMNDTGWGRATRGSEKQV